MRKTFWIKAAMLLSVGVGTEAFCASIDCKAPRLDNVEKAICGSPELMASDRDIAEVFVRRLAQCAPRQRTLLRQTQKFWLRDRNACANALSEGEDAMKRCVAEKMDERAVQLRRIGDTCDLDSVAGEYRYVDSDYLATVASRYVGREVSVWGGIRLSSCDVNSSSLTAKLQSMPGKDGSFPVRFKAMPPLKREWLCAQNPASHWQGTVRQDAGEFYLYLTDILGDPL
jgi:uncharacterized protein YecT (DUF1311 family)